MSDTLSAFKSHMVEIYCPCAVLPPELSFMCLQFAGLVSVSQKGSRFFILYHEQRGGSYASRHAENQPYKRRSTFRPNRRRADPQ